MKKSNYFTRYIVLLSLPFLMALTNFDELDKPPEGAYKGQIFAGASVSMGIASGKAIKAEKNFVSGSTYTFPESGIIKKVELAHLNFGFGIFGEYMPIDNLGIKLQLRNSQIVQRTRFGADYRNSKGVLYRDFSLLTGPVIHATTRKPWDVTFHPFAGIAYSIFEATPAAKSLFDSYDPKTKNSYISFAFGADITGHIYLSGGLFISLGMQWIRNFVKLAEDISEPNPQTGAIYMNGGTSSTIDSFSIVLSAGYAFYN